MTAAALKIDAAVRRISSAAARLAVALLLAQAFLILIDALLRWWFSTPIHGLEDVSGLLIAIIVASFLPSVLIARQNIRVTLAGRFFSARVSAWFDVFGHVVLLAFVVIIAWQYVHYVIETLHYTTPILRLPVAPAMILSAVIVALCAPIQAFVLLMEILKAAHAKKNGQD